jgi:esterase/lipase superfamily enzyme
MAFVLAKVGIISVFVSNPVTCVFMSWPSDLLELVLH